MDIEKLRLVLEAIPPGRWASYADVAAAVGAPPAAARRVNQQIIRHALQNGHRVLKGDGRVAPTALGEPDAVRARLEAEGVVFGPDDRARQAARYRPGPLPAEDAAAGGGSAPARGPRPEGAVAERGAGRRRPA